MMYDAPVVKYKKDESNKPKPGEKGYTMTAEKAQAAYEEWKKRKKYDLTALMEKGETVPATK